MHTKDVAWLGWKLTTQLFGSVHTHVIKAFISLLNMWHIHTASTFYSKHYYGPGTGNNLIN